MDKYSILLIHPFLSYPLRSGGHHGLFNGILAIKDDFDLTLVFEGDDTEQMRKNIDEFKKYAPNVALRPLLHTLPEVQNLTAGEKIYSFLRIIYHKFLKIIRLILGIKPPKNQPVNIDISEGWISSITPSSKEWIEHIYRVSRERKFDLIQVEMPWLISDVLAMPHNIKVIHVHHELGFVRRELELNGLSDNYSLVRKEFVDFNEIGLLNKYDGIITVSSIDRDKLIQAGVNVPVYSSFAIVDSFLTPKNNTGPCRKLTFVGYGNHSPNVLGIKWFLENCWDKLLNDNPNYSLDIIGQWSDYQKAAIDRKFENVNFVGYVDDLSQAISDSIMIVPITVGSGIRIKILEASCRCVPFVSTTIGAEGLPFTSGENCFITDEPDSFVEAIVKLNDSSLRNTFVSRANNLVKTRFSLSALRQNRLEIYSSLFDGGR